MLMRSPCTSTGVVEVSSMVDCWRPDTCPTGARAHRAGSKTEQVCALLAARPERISHRYVNLADYWRARESGVTQADMVEVAGLGVDLSWYWGAREVGYAHAECAEIARSGGNLNGYRSAREVGYAHDELVEIARLGGHLSWYRKARGAGCTHATIVGAVTVHGLPPDMLDPFAERMAATPDADVATVVFETVAGVE